MNIKVLYLANIVICCLLASSCALHKCAVPASVPEDMVLVPAGEFIMGNNNDFYDNDNDEMPRHVVNLPSFYINKYPVTNYQYKKFVDATGHKTPRYWGKSGKFSPEKANHPVVGISFPDAQAYAAWKGKRLPTEEEWEKAARSTDARRWPWGNLFDYSKANVGTKGTTPVGSFPEGKTIYGAYDMSGNVWEWVDSWYELYPGISENKSVEQLLGKKNKVVRGGSFASDIGSARCADRGVKKIKDSGTTLGFRCARDVPGYEDYRSAARLIARAKKLKARAELDITAYEDHRLSRLIMRNAESLMVQASAKFQANDFSGAMELAGEANKKIKTAHQLALDFKKIKHAEKKALIEKTLTEFDSLISQLPDQLTPKELKLKKWALNHFTKGKQFFDDESWGYAQMHALIALKMVKMILDPDAVSSASIITGNQ